MRKGRIAGIVAAIATLVASLGFGGAALAAGTDSAAANDSITLTSQSGVTLNADNFKAYKLTNYASIVEDQTDTDKIDGLIATKVSDAAETAINDALTANNVTVPGGDNAAENRLLRMGSEDSAKSSQGKIAAVADALAGKVSSFGTAIAATTTDGGKTVSFTNLEPGYYLVIDSGAQAKPILISSTVNGRHKLGSQTIGSGEVKSENGAQTNPTKTMAGDNGKAADATLTNPTADGTVTVGKSYKFTLNFTVPNSLTWADFTATDTPTGMTIDPSSIAYAISDTRADAADATTTNAGLTSTTLSKTNNGLKIALVDGALSATSDPAAQANADGNYDEASAFVKANSGKTVTITYTATVDKANAKNSFSVTSTPLHGSPVTPPPVVVKTHSYEVKLHKISAADRDANKSNAEDITKAGLANAEFTIKRDENGKYLSYDAQHSTWVESDTATPVKTDASGNIDLPNIGEGTYYLTETTAPAGFSNANKPVVKVTVTKNATDATKADVTAAGNTDATKGDILNAGLVDSLTDTYAPAVGSTDAHVPTVAVANINSLAQLPQTGGAGIIAIALLLAVLLIAGVGVGFAARKVNERRLAVSKN